MKKKEKIKDKDYKFDKRLQKTIINNFGRFLDNFISEYEEKNKDWITRHLLRIIFHSLRQLKYYIDDPRDPEISWDNPYVEVQYPVEIDWEKTNLSPNAPNLHTILRIDIGSGLETLEDLAKVTMESLSKSKDIALFRWLTKDIAFIIKEKNTQVLLPRNILEYLEKEVPKEDYDDAIEKISTKEIYIPLVSKEEREENETEDYIYLKFSGLTINLDEKKAYYPIVVGLSLPSITQLLVNEDVKTRSVIMNTLWEGIYLTIITELAKLNKQEILPVRAFTTLLVDNETFAIPSNPLMFTLLAMFAGRPERIPRNLLEKPHNERTPEEKEVADQFIHSIFDKQTSVSYDNKGREVRETKTMAVLADNPKVEAKTEIGTTLFGDDLSWKEESLALYIKRTFGAEGLRHLLGILIGLNDAGRTGEYEWNVNEHLDRLGYKRMQNGTYSYNLKQTALEIIKIFTSLFITATNKDEKGTGKIKGKRLFYIEGYEKEYKENWVVNEKLTIKASDYWYRNAFETSKGSSQQFTKLLKEIARENHREHALTIYLAPLLAVFWRINPEVRELSFKNLLEWCDIDLNKDPHKMRTIKDIESEFEYMRLKGYLGSWENKTTNAPLSESTDPLNCILAFYPPDWLKEEFKLISSKKKIYLKERLRQGKAQGNSPCEINTSQGKPFTKEEFAKLLNNTGLTIKQFANHLGVSRQMVSYIKSGKRRISPQLEEKIREVFGHMLPV